MSLAKIIRLASVTAIVALALTAISGASASTLNIAACKVDQLTCESKNIITHLHDESSNGVLLTSIHNVTCKVLGLGDVLSSGGLAHLTLIASGKSTFSNCKTPGGGSCEVQELNGPAVSEIMAIGSEEAEVVGEGEILVGCNSGMHCVYSAEELNRQIFGALAKEPNGEGTMHEQAISRVSGFFCPETSKMDALAKPSTPLYLSS